MRNLLKITQLIVLVSFATLWGCSGGGSSSVSATAANSVQLISSSSQLQSGSGGSVTLTAYIKDGNNNLIEGEAVTFSVDLDGTLAIVRGTTDSTGTAEATLTSPTNFSNRTLTATATAGTVSGSASVDVTGASIQVSGSSQLVITGNTTLTIIAEDGSGNKIVGQQLTVASANSNTLSTTTITTDAGGSATVNVTGDNAGADIITVTGMGISTAFSISVSSASSFVITVTDPGTPSDTDIELGDNVNISVTWLDATPAPVNGQTITFSATRGSFSTTTCVTNTAGITFGAGQCSVNLSSTNAGPAEVIATTASGPSTSATIEFIAVLDGIGAETINLQADKVSVATNGDTSTLTAVVRDENSNFVKGATVNFSLVDVSGGSISPLTAVTDSLGRATTIYTSSAASSATDGVSITATEASQSLTSTETLTVADQQLFITLGTSHLLGSPSDSVLTREFGVFVTDAFGNAASSVSVQLGLKPLQPGASNVPGDDTDSDTKAYRKGIWSVQDVAGTDEWVQTINAYCNTEDADLDGILDPGEDTNSDTVLWPGNTAFVPGSVTTDTNGYATFDVTYLKNFAYWSSVEITASASVSGTESIAKHVMLLTGLASDYADVDSGVPGQTSPFGTSAVCANPG